MVERKVFHDSVVPIPVESGPAPHGLMVQPASSEHQDEKMTLHFSLALPEQVEADLEAKVARGETVPAAELSGYGAQKADADALTAWLETQGFQIESVSADNTSIYASAPVAQIEQSLQVQMVRVNREGFTYTASRNAPSLPVPVGAAVQAIGGLQPFQQAHKHNRRRLPRNSNRSALGVTGPGAPEPSANISNSPPYLPGEILQAYNASGLGLDGSGQTIAILIDTFPADADMQAFWQQANLPVTLAQIEKINVSGGQLPPPEGEETLDAQWTSGIAPGATIRIYATGGLQFTALDQALDRIIDDIPSQPGMRQLSISLGLGETFLNGPGGEVATQHQKFLKLAAAGVNVFVSTGDAGSNPDETGHSATGPTQAEYESTDPCVIAVGGTTLKLAPDGTVAGEAGLAGRRGREERLLPSPAMAGRIRRDRPAQARPRRQRHGRPRRRGLAGPEWPGPPDRRHQLERTGLGRVLRTAELSPRQGQQAAVAVPEPADLPAGGLVLPGHPDREQRDLPRDARLRPGDRARRTRRASTGQSPGMTDLA